MKEKCLYFRAIDAGYQLLDDPKDMEERITKTRKYENTKKRIIEIQQGRLLSHPAFSGMRE